MKKMTTPFAMAMGAALISSVSATAVNAEANPFGATELSSGYMQLAAAEMACGAGMKMEKPTAIIKPTNMPMALIQKMATKFISRRNKLNEVEFNGITKKFRDNNRNTSIK